VAGSAIFSTFIQTNFRHRFSRISPWRGIDFCWCMDR